MKDFLIELIDNIVKVVGAGGASIKFTDADMSLVAGLWKYLALIGVCLTLTYFLLEMNRRYALEGGDVNFKTMFAPFLKLIMALILLSQGAKIISRVVAIGNIWADDFVVEMGLEEDAEKATSGTGGTDATSGTDETNANAESLKDVIGKLGFFKQIAMIIPILVAYLIALAIRIAWEYKAILYKLEVLFRVGISPIALADIYSGQNSNAIRWVKGMIALVLYGASLTILPALGIKFGVTKLAEGLDASSLWGAFYGIVLLIVAPFAALSCASVAKQACKEALGA